MSTVDTPGIIEPGRLYTAEEARQRLRMGRKAWKELRDAGLYVVYRGRQAYVFGDDLLRIFRGEIDRRQTASVGGDA